MVSPLPQYLFKRGETFFVRYTVPQELVATVGRKEIVRSLKTKNLTDAVYSRDMVLDEIRKTALNGNPMPMTAPPSGDKETTVKEAAHRWLQLADGIRPSTRYRYQRYLGRFINWSGNVGVSELNRELALRFYDHLRQTPSPRTGKLISERTLLSYTNCLASFWKVLDYWSLVDPEAKNPFSGLNRKLPGKRKTVNRPPRVLRPVTRAEAERLLAYIAGADRMKYRREMTVIIRLLWSTGCRLNEVCSLLLSDIEDRGDHIELNIREAKTDAGNRVVMIVDASDMELLRETIRFALITEPLDHRNKGMLFPRLRRGGYDLKANWYVGKALEAARKADPEHDGTWDMHSFRRNAVSALINAGVAKEARNLVIGHSNKDDIGMDVYAKHGDLREIVLVTFRALMEELGGALQVST
ncbi:site-specific integrase [Tropicimonas sediminicola]|uniref:Site-specific recombinase XerD n=1 Tax=Tropicimonas sediminicola TaxID=1031541 RepID=A0A239GM87_9RHOB|nr:site-specific integrase [Tropicimonas sediminicola]SNS69932.1 Site-specific recombinase XerD [Tropicimonas sediminicola]